MNVLWPVLISVSYIYAILNGKILELNNSIFQAVNDVLKIIFVLVGNTCLWCGLMNIIKNTKLSNFLIIILRPFINWIFQKEKNNKEVLEKISINIVSNFLGIGNAATPAGLEAMKVMQINNKNKQYLTDSMAMLIVINTTSIQLIPTTVLSIRASLGSVNPTNIILPIWISTIVGTIVGIIATKILIYKKGEE